MKEQILNVFATLGFQLEEMEGFGYGFQYEGINYLFMPISWRLTMIIFMLPSC